MEMEASTNSLRISPSSVHGYKKKETITQKDSPIPRSVSEIDMAVSEETATSSERESPLNKSSSVSLSEPQCRICLGGQESGVLIKACRCSGSIAYAHKTCLERWLNEKGTDRCEICTARCQQTRTLQNVFQWIFPVSMCSPNLFRGLFLTTVIWICVYYFIVIAIPPQHLVMKEVFFCLMYSLLIVLIVMTLVIFKNTCQPFTLSVRQWVYLNTRTPFIEAEP